MGARGKLQVPSHLRAVTDSESPSTVAETVPREAPAKPAVIADNAELSAKWDSFVPKLDAMGLASPVDGDIYASICMSSFLRDLAFTQIDGAVSVEASRNAGIKKSPAEAIFRAQTELLLKLHERAGMTFVSRARTPAAKGREDDERNPFASTGG